MNRRGAMLRAVLFVAAALLPASLLAPSAASVAASPTSRYASQAFSATNDARADHGRAALSSSRCLKKFAARQAQKMANDRAISHQNLQTILNQCRLRAVGENVAYGFPNGNAVVRGWMNSPDHRANILNRGYRQMGIAARQSSDGTWYVAQVFGRRL